MKRTLMAALAVTLAAGALGAPALASAHDNPGVHAERGSVRAFERHDRVIVVRHHRFEGRHHRFEERRRYAEWRHHRHERAYGHHHGRSW
jgi:Ni/Co efflux regulator RcnB